MKFCKLVLALYCSLTYMALQAAAQSPPTDASTAVWLVAKNQAQQNPPAGNASPSQIRLAGGTKVIVKYPDGAEVKLSPEEQVAFVFVENMELLEYGCFNPSYLGRACSLVELIQAVRGKKGEMLGLNQNPNQDSNYRYKLTISDTGDGYQIEAIPQRAGLGGFLCLGKKGYMFGDHFYNPKGAATTTSSRLETYSVSGHDFRRSQF